ncbi:hypothetical protein M8994_23060, partial [Brucella sp. 21LCYQ03]|nr:hypothetical protein [Brucella sp. 21LCYQ03]
VEQSQVTGFILRRAAQTSGSTACVARWQIQSVPSKQLGGLPGLGFPRWEVSLMKVRNGHPGNWLVEWSPSGFQIIPVSYAQTTKEELSQQTRQLGS